MTDLLVPFVLQRPALRTRKREARRPRDRAQAEVRRTECSRQESNLHVTRASRDCQMPKGRSGRPRGPFDRVTSERAFIWCEISRDKATASTWPGEHGSPAVLGQGDGRDFFAEDLRPMGSGAIGRRGGCPSPAAKRSLDRRGCGRSAHERTATALAVRSFVPMAWRPDRRVPVTPASARGHATDGLGDQLVARDAGLAAEPWRGLTHAPRSAPARSCLASSPSACPCRRPMRPSLTFVDEGRVQGRRGSSGPRIVMFERVVEWRAWPRKTWRCERLTEITGDAAERRATATVRRRAWRAGAPSGLAGGAVGRAHRNRSAVRRRRHGSRAYGRDAAIGVPFAA